MLYKKQRLVGGVIGALVGVILGLLFTSSCETHTSTQETGILMSHRTAIEVGTTRSSLGKVRPFDVVAVNSAAMEKALSATEAESLRVFMDIMFRAICEVESNNDCEKVGAAGEIGPAQIMDICLKDCNRLVGYERWDSQDRKNPEMVREMFNIYVLNYLGPALDTMLASEAVARIWNGGPNGWKRASTLPYWKKVSAVLKRNSKDEAKKFF